MEDLLRTLDNPDDLSEEEILYWSSPYYEQIQEEKRIKKELQDERRDLENG